MEAIKIQPESEPIVVLQLQREMDEEIRHWFLGQALKRIRRFCEQYDSEADGLVMSREVERDFAKDRDRQFMILLAVREIKVVGHFLAEHYQYYGRGYISIMQFEMNLDARLAREQEEFAFQLVLNWRREIGAKGIKAIVEKPAHIMWYTQFGFTKKKTLMEWKG